MRACAGRFVPRHLLRRGDARLQSVRLPDSAHAPRAWPAALVFPGDARHGPLRAGHRTRARTGADRRGARVPRRRTPQLVRAAESVVRALPARHGWTARSDYRDWTLRNHRSRLRARHADHRWAMGPTPRPWRASASSTPTRPSRTSRASSTRWREASAGGSPRRSPASTSCAKAAPQPSWKPIVSWVSAAVGRALCIATARYFVPAPCGSMVMMAVKVRHARSVLTSAHGRKPGLEQPSSRRGARFRHDLQVTGEMFAGARRRAPRAPRGTCPPGRKSTSHSAVVHGRGQNHWLEMLGRGPGQPDQIRRHVHDALHHEVERRIRYIRNAHAPSFLRVVEIRIELSRGGSPTPCAAACQPRARRPARLLRGERIGADAADLARGDEAAGFEHPEVLREGRQRHREAARQLARGAWPARSSRASTARRVGSASAENTCVSCCDWLGMRLTVDRHEYSGQYLSDGGG